MSRKGGLKDLGTLRPGDFMAQSEARGNNDLGHVVGWSSCASAPCSGNRGFFYNGTGMHDVNTMLDVPRADPIVDLRGITVSDRMVGYTAAGQAVLLTRVQ